MPLALDRKKSLIEQFRTHDGDTGSPEVQIARGLLEYLRKKDAERYRAIIEKLGIRR